MGKPELTEELNRIEEANIVCKGFYRSKETLDGKDLHTVLKEKNSDLKVLLYGSEFDMKKYAPKGEYKAEISGDIPGGLYSLGTAIYGYDFFTKDRLTEEERVLRAKDVKRKCS